MANYKNLKETSLPLGEMITELETAAKEAEWGLSAADCVNLLLYRGEIRDANGGERLGSYIWRERREYYDEQTDLLVVSLKLRLKKGVKPDVKVRLKEKFARRHFSKGIDLD